MKYLLSKKFSSVIFIILSTGIDIACQKDNLQVSNSTAASSVAASVSGRITDLNNLPVSNASVIAGSSVTITDKNGLFTIKNAQLHKDAGFVIVTKAGYFPGARTFSVNSFAVNNVKIQLIPKTVSGSFETSSGGTVDISGGGVVSFISGNLVDATNSTAYLGTVAVSTFYLDPLASNFNEYMPGDLRGMNTSNQVSILKPFGMASIEPDNTSGGRLQLASGKTATISLPIPNALQANAPASIALWYFDETSGFWKQEGSAVRQGTNYVGAVAHFSFWATGQLTQSISLKAGFKDSLGESLANKLVSLTSTAYGTSSSLTDSAGTISGLVPANEALVMNMINDCGDIMFTQNIGPFSSDADLGAIRVISIAPPCSNDSLYIHLTLSGQVYSWAPPDSLGIAHGIDTSGNPYALILAQNANNLYFQISNDNSIPGTYDNSYLSVTIDGINYFSYYAMTTTTTITEYGSVGGVVVGTASGTLIKDYPDSATHIPFEMSYKVIRSQ